MKRILDGMNRAIDIIATAIAIVTWIAIVLMLIVMLPFLMISMGIIELYQYIREYQYRK